MGTRCMAGFERINVMLLFSRLFLKVMPENDENGYGAFIRNRKLDVTEVEAYRTVLRDLVGFLFFASMFPSDFCQVPKRFSGLLF